MKLIKQSSTTINQTGTSVLKWIGVLFGLCSSLQFLAAQNLVLNPGLEDIELMQYNTTIGIDGVMFNYMEEDTAYLWGLVDKRLAGLHVKHWNYDNLPNIKRGYTGQYSNCGLSHTGKNLNVIEVFKTWKDVATVKNVVASLCKPMERGETYLVSFYLKPLYGNQFTSNLGVWINKEVIPLHFQFNQKEYLDSVKQKLLAPAEQADFALPDILSDTSKYTFYQFTYIAEGGEQYIYIGNLFFNNDAFWRKKTWINTSQYGFQKNRSDWSGAYYGVDDLSVINLDDKADTCISVRNETQTQFNDTVFLFSIYFRFDAFKNDSLIDSLAGIINQQEDVEQLLLIGHADATGTEQYNLELSLKRANFIKNSLQSKTKLSIQTLGMGSSQHLTHTDERNRRVDVCVLK